MDDIMCNVTENGGPLYIGQSQYVCLVLYYLYAQYVTARRIIARYHHKIKYK